MLLELDENKKDIPYPLAYNLVFLWTLPEYLNPNKLLDSNR